jgi:hypothetical protein
MNFTLVGTVAQHAAFPCRVSFSLNQIEGNPLYLLAPRWGCGDKGWMNTLLSIGHGYSAQALSRRLIPLGWRVIGTTRSADKAERLAAMGVEALIWPGDISQALTQATHLLTSVAPDAAGDPVVQALGPQIVAANLDWVGYLSTTAVYGHHGGLRGCGPRRNGRLWACLCTFSGWRGFTGRGADPLKRCAMARRGGY